MKAFQQLSKICFPKPKSINITMMPFIMGDPQSIPMKYREYWQMIKSCNIPALEYGKVGYLSVMECRIKANATPHAASICTNSRQARGGLFMAFNQENTCKIWNYPRSSSNITHSSSNPLRTTYSCSARSPSFVNNSIIDHEDCSHHVDEMGEPTMMKANHLYWVTNCTPHEVLGLNRTAYHQWFCLIPHICTWYSADYTHNSLGISPPSEVLINTTKKLRFSTKN